jgi:hypothetical protein
MTIDQAVKEYLLSITAISTAISTRLYPAVASNGSTVPYVLYNTIGRDEGEINNTFGSYFKYFQFTVFARTYLETVTIGELIISAFCNKPLKSYTGIQIINGNISGERDLSFDTENELYSKAIDIKVNYAKV